MLNKYYSDYLIIGNELLIQQFIGIIKLRCLSLFTGYNYLFNNITKFNIDCYE